MPAPLINVGGVMGLHSTRTLSDFLRDPNAAVVPHDHQPNCAHCDPVLVPPGPQMGPAFLRFGGVNAATYDPPAFADDGGVPGGIVLRQGGW